MEIIFLDSDIIFVEYLKWLDIIKTMTINH